VCRQSLSSGGRIEYIQKRPQDLGVRYMFGSPPHLKTQPSRIFGTSLQKNLVRKGEKWGRGTERKKFGGKGGSFPFPLKGRGGLNCWGWVEE